MKLLEIKNNLAKLSYTNEDKLALSQFVALVDKSCSYVGQIVNLKAEVSSNYAVAKLIFTFNDEGIVDNYDGTIPSTKAQLSKLDAKNILSLLPLETPVIFGYLAQQPLVLKLDQTIFENNLLICAEKFENIYTIVKNCIKQIEKLNEKSVILDTDHTFGEIESVRFKRDFKLPLNAEMIDYIYKNDLAEVDAASKAVIQDIFYEVQEYSKTVEDGFIPFNTFLSVVAAQYKQTNIPELALLKNKLLKYQEDNTFAQTKEDLDGLKEAIANNNKTTFIDIADVPDEMQNSLISYVHSILDSESEYVYMFVKLTNKNSDKKLLRQILDNNHIFTINVCSHNYKYIVELKQRAENIILFAPQTLQHDFAAYNVFLNKLNANEFIVYGNLTQNVPFIVELSDFSEEEPAENEEPIEDIKEVDGSKESDETEQAEELTETEAVEPAAELPEIEETDELLIPEEPQPDLEMPDDLSDTFDGTEFTDKTPTHEELVEQAAKDVDEILYNKTEEIPSIEEITQDSNENLTEDDLDFIDDLVIEESEPAPEQAGEQPLEEILTQEPAAVIEEFSKDITEELPQEQELPQEPQPPVVPVYPAETPVLAENSPMFEQGDTVEHPKYGKGVIEKLIKYGNKTLCSISFENVGRRLLDPAISDITKIE